MPDDRRPARARRADRPPLRFPPRHRQVDGPRDGGRPSQDRHGLRQAARRERAGAQRHRRAPRRHPVDLLLYAHRHGRRRHQWSPPGRPARVLREVHPASGTTPVTLPGNKIIGILMPFLMPLTT